MTNNGTDTGSQQDFTLNVMVSIQLGVWCTFCTCLVFYLMVRASPTIAECWYCLLQGPGDPRIDDGCNPSFLVLAMLVAYPMVFLYCVNWTLKIAQIVQLVLLALYVTGLLGFGIHSLVKWWRSKYTLFGFKLDALRCEHLAVSLKFAGIGCVCASLDLYYDWSAFRFEKKNYDCLS